MRVSVIVKRIGNETDCFDLRGVVAIKLPALQKLPASTISGPAQRYESKSSGEPVAV